MYRNFWKNICECKLLPLTTDFFPSEVDFNRRGLYRSHKEHLDKPKNSISLVPSDKHYLEEFLCLRLVQNFQLYTNEAICHIDHKEFLKQSL